MKWVVSLCWFWLPLLLVSRWIYLLLIHSVVSNWLIIVCCFNYRISYYCDGCCGSAHQPQMPSLLVVSSWCLSCCLPLCSSTHSASWSGQLKLPEQSLRYTHLTPPIVWYFYSSHPETMVASPPTVGPDFMASSSIYAWSSLACCWWDCS